MGSLCIKADRFQIIPPQDRSLIRLAVNKGINFDEVVQYLQFIAKKNAYYLLVQQQGEIYVEVMKLDLQNAMEKKGTWTKAIDFNIKTMGEKERQAREAIMKFQSSGKLKIANKNYMQSEIKYQIPNDKPASLSGQRNQERMDVGLAQMQQAGVSASHQAGEKQAIPYIDEYKPSLKESEIGDCRMQINNYHYESSYNSFRTEQYVEQEDMKRFYTEKGTQESIEQERRRCIDLTVQNNFFKDKIKNLLTQEECQNRATKILLQTLARPFLDSKTIPICEDVVRGMRNRDFISRILGMRKFDYNLLYRFDQIYPIGGSLQNKQHLLVLLRFKETIIGGYTGVNADNGMIKEAVLFSLQPHKQMFLKAQEPVSHIAKSVSEICFGKNEFKIKLGSLNCILDIGNPNSCFRSEQGRVSCKQFSGIARGSFDAESYEVYQLYFFPI